jgi:hypothetical protein
MRLKARWLDQHGGRVTQQGVILYVGPSMPPALTDHTTCHSLGLIYYKMYTKHRHELRHARKAWVGTLVDPSLLSALKVL